MNVFDFAMKIELQGKAYYETLAESARIPELKGIFTGLAADEQKHYDLFKSLKEEKEWGMADSTMLLQARSVFTDLIDRPEAPREMQDALGAYQLALKMEAESVRLYEQMAKKEEDPVLVRLYLTLANEEKSHYNILDNLCELAKRPNECVPWRESKGSE
ncbi:ferritin-like domain-containing protein [Citrifermentans bremense]|uniref:ferritin-like domain-containing protein n=1 Tax=Citrifermentans bremense TaxID=60035 RepID=UPI000429CF29|nr:ferritin family protein [Citrifermentans bremense]